MAADEEDDLDLAGEADIAATVAADPADPLGTIRPSGEMSPELDAIDGDRGKLEPPEGPEVSTIDTAAPLALIDDEEMRGALEAILLVVDEPVQEIMLAQVMEQPTERVAETLEEIARDYKTPATGSSCARSAAAGASTRDPGTRPM